MATYDELVVLIRAAFHDLGVPVIVRFVSATLDFDTWFKPCIDPKLSNFSRQHANFHPGMHALR